jgi:hypothetical protein
MLRIGARSRSFGIGVLGLSLAATLVAAGCTPQDLEEFLGDVKDGPAQPPGTAIPFQTFTDDVSAVSAKETRALIRTSQGYVSFFGHAAPAGVDFSTDWVIFYSAGTKHTGGFDASIASLTRAGSQLVAVTSLSSPGPACIEPQIVTTPNVLIKFAAQTGAAIQFFKNDSVNDCGTNNPCAAVTCPVGSTCVVVEPPCLPGALCPPIGACVPQKVQHCGGIAGIACPGSGQCVDDPSDSCDPNNGGADCGGICKCLPVPILCAKGGHFDTSPSVCDCVTDPPPPPPPLRCGGFAGLKCPGAGTCVDDPSDSCDPKNGDTDCFGICQCSGAAVLCAVGDIFDSSPGVCACVPKTPPPPPVVHCGGIAGIQCPGGGRCADDPNDSCDPNNGGADCGGICQCIETVSCIARDVFDSSPGVCACVPKAPPACPPVCAIFCAYGNVLDANGCPTCTCNPPPKG